MRANLEIPASSPRVAARGGESRSAPPVPAPQTADSLTLDGAERARLAAAAPRFMPPRAKTLLHRATELAAQGTRMCLNGAVSACDRIALAWTARATPKLTASLERFRADTLRWRPQDEPRNPKGLARASTREAEPELPPALLEGLPKNGVVGLIHEIRSGRCPQGTWRLAQHRDVLQELSDSQLQQTRQAIAWNPAAPAAPLPEASREENITHIMSRLWEGRATPTSPADQAAFEAKLKQTESELASLCARGATDISVDELARFYRTHPLYTLFDAFGGDADTPRHPYACIERWLPTVDRLPRVYQTLMRGVIETHASERRARLVAGQYHAAEFHNDIERFNNSHEATAFASAVLGIETDPAAGRGSPGPYCVHFQPTPTDIASRLLRRLNLTQKDELWDLGSGRGQLVLMTAGFTPARAVGVEMQKEHFDAAVSAAHALGSDRARFIHGDVRDPDFSSGTVFYFFNPFTGPIMDRVLEKLRDVAKQHPITLCFYGCDPFKNPRGPARFNDRTWVEPDKDTELARMGASVYRSRPPSG